MTHEQGFTQDEHKNVIAAFFSSDSPKVFIAKELTQSFPYSEAALLSYIGHHIHEEKSGWTKVRHDERWLVQKRSMVASYLGMSTKTLEGVAKRLRDDGVLITETIGTQRQLFWRIDPERLLDKVTSSNATKSHPQNKGMESTDSRACIYKNNQIQNSGDTYVSPGQPAAGADTSSSVILGKKPKLNAASKFKARKSTKSVTPDKYVEYWNSLPYVPKNKIGTKNYERSRAFFKAHQKYEIGTGDWGDWRLPEEYNPLLRKLNHMAAHKKGKRPLERSHEEMIEHIETAALAFNPEYYPVDTTKLKRLGLADFLFNKNSKKSGVSSTFVKFVTQPPRRIDDAEALLENQDDYIHDIVSVIFKVYNIARDRYYNEDISDSEIRAAIRIAHNIAEEYVKIPMTVHAFVHHFGDYMAFINHWKRYMEDQVWQGMPITALDPSKDLWRRFVDYTSADIGRYLYTGERVN